MPINIRYNNSNPAIALFNANQQQDNARRQQEEAAFRQQFQDEQAAGVDKAIRTGYGRMQTPVSAPTPVQAQVPAPVAAPAMPQQPIGIDSEVQGNVADISGPRPAIAAATASPGAAQAPIAQPAGTPAIASATTAPRPAGRYAPVMEELSRTRGGGAAMMQIDQLQQAAEIAAFRALHNAEPDIAAAIAQRYGLNLPPQFLKDKRFQQELAQLGDLIKRARVSDANAAMQITRNYLEARKNGADSQVASQGALNNVQVAPKPAPGVREIYDPNRGVFVRRPDAENPNGTVLQPPGLPARQYSPSSGGGASGGKQEEYAKWRIKTLVQSGMPLAEAQSVVAGRLGQVSRKDVATMATKLLKTTDVNGDRIYKNLNEAMTAANRALGIEQQPATGGSAANQGASPYPDGTKLQGPDGTYTVRGGKPVKD